MSGVRAFVLVFGDLMTLFGCVTHDNLTCDLLDSTMMDIVMLLCVTAMEKKGGPQGGQGGRGDSHSVEACCDNAMTFARECSSSGGAALGCQV